MKKTMKKSFAVLFALSVSATGTAYASVDITVPADAPVAVTAVPISAPVTAVPISAPVTAVPISAPVENGAVETIFISLDGTKLDGAGYRTEGAKEALVPLRDVAEALGMEVIWDNDEQAAEVKKGALWTIVKIGEDRYTINKMYKSLGTAPELTDSKTYVPVSFVTEVLHANAVLDGNTVKITTKEQIKTELTKGHVTDVYSSEGRSFIHINGQGTDGIVLNVSEETAFVDKDGKELTLEDVTIGTLIEAEHSLAMTMSLPPQTSVFQVTVLAKPEENELLGTAGVIETATVEDGEVVSVRVKGSALKEGMQDEIVLRLGEKTEIVDINGETVAASELTEGTNVIAFYGPVMTKSLPPIGTAVKFVVQPAVEQPEDDKQQPAPGEEQTGNTGKDDAAAETEQPADEQQGDDAVQDDADQTDADQADADQADADQDAAEQNG